MTKLLEDELRFRYSDEAHDDMFKIYIGALNIIDWNSPSDNLVLLNDMCGKMQNNAVLVCLAQFIKSSAFNYTLLSNGMCEKLSNTNDGKTFYNIIGQEVLKWYKEEDKWHSIVILDNEKNIIANIYNVDDLSIFKKIQFDWKSAPGKDTQALAHGYVNIKI